MQKKRLKVALELIKKRLKLKNNYNKNTLSAGQLEYMRKLLRTEKGCEKLVNPQNYGRKSVILPEHVEAVKKEARLFGLKKFTGKLICERLIYRHPELPRLGLSTVHKILRQRLRYKWRRVDIRDACVLTKEHAENRRDCAKILLSLHALGHHLIFVDEHSMNETKGKIPKNLEKR